jgi:hypothetical protein
MGPGLRRDGILFCWSVSEIRSGSRYSGVSTGSLLCRRATRFISSRRSCNAWSALYDILAKARRKLSVRGSWNSVSSPSFGVVAAIRTTLS